MMEEVTVVIIAIGGGTLVLGFCLLLTWGLRRLWNAWWCWRLECAWNRYAEALNKMTKEVMKAVRNIRS